MKSQIKLISLFLSFSLLFISCSQNYTENIERNSDKSFFKEIFFGKANNSKLTHVNELLMSSKKSSSNQRSLIPDELDYIIEVLVEKIDLIDPDFFIRFNEMIQSGDHIVIEQALNDGGKILEEALLATPEIAEEVLFGKKIANEIDINDFLTEDGVIDSNRLIDFVEDMYQQELALISPTFVFAAAYVVVAVSVVAAVNYAGAVNVYVWFNAWRWTNKYTPKSSLSSRISPSNSNLQFEIMINEIAIYYKK